MKIYLQESDEDILDDNTDAERQDVDSLLPCRGWVVSKLQKKQESRSSTFCKFDQLLHEKCFAEVEILMRHA